ncbi:MAG: hypothetical protein WCL49_08080 [bacterium]
MWKIGFGSAIGIVGQYAVGETVLGDDGHSLKYGPKVSPHELETFPVPEKALREAIINAVAHKDYASAIPIRISVYADKLMIWNPGQRPHGWALGKLTTKRRPLGSAEI